MDKDIFITQMGNWCLWGVLCRFIVGRFLLKKHIFIISTYDFHDSTELYGITSLYQCTHICGTVAGWKVLIKETHLYYFHYDFHDSTEQYGQLSSFKNSLPFLSFTMHVKGWFFNPPRTTWTGWLVKTNEVSMFKPIRDIVR